MATRELMPIRVLFLCTVGSDYRLPYVYNFRYCAAYHCSKA